MAAPEPVLLRVGQQTVPGAPGPGLAAAIEAANQAARIPGLADTLNPGIIDPDKAARFVAALPKQPAATLARIAGHELALGAGGLGVGAAAPTRADAFGTFELVVDDVQGRNVLAHTSVAPDPALARSRAAEAKAALQEAEAAVTRAERANAGDEIGHTRRRRAAAAGAWRLNAAAWAKGAPGDAAAQEALAASQKAARAYAMPSGALPG